MNTQPEFTLLYDGDCPICQKEVGWLRWKNKLGKLGFQDINATEFDPGAYGKSHAELMAEIHGFYPDGKIVKGMPVFRAAYRALGLGWLMAATDWPVLRSLFDLLYSWFARHRLGLGRLLGGNRCKQRGCDVSKR